MRWAMILKIIKPVINVSWIPRLVFHFSLLFKVLHGAGCKANPAIHKKEPLYSQLCCKSTIPEIKRTIPQNRMLNFRINVSIFSFILSHEFDFEGMYYDVYLDIIMINNCPFVFFYGYGKYLILFFWGYLWFAKSLALPVFTDVFCVYFG